MFNVRNYLDFGHGVRRGRLGRSKYRIVREQTMLKSQPFVELHRPRVLRSYVEKRSFVSLPNAIREDGH